MIGTLMTIALIILTAFIGVNLLRQQGVATLNRAQQALSRGEVPAAEMLEGIVLLVAGALLLTPGFFTDTLGFLALVPTLRRSLAQRFTSFGPLNQGGFSTDQQQRPNTEPTKPYRQGTTIDGEFRQED